MSECVCAWRDVALHLISWGVWVQCIISCCTRRVTQASWIDRIYILSYKFILLYLLEQSTSRSESPWKCLRRHRCQILLFLFLDSYRFDHFLMAGRLVKNSCKFRDLKLGLLIIEDSLGSSNGFWRLAKLYRRHFWDKINWLLRVELLKSSYAENLLLVKFSDTICPSSRKSYLWPNLEKST